MRGRPGLPASWTARSNTGPGAQSYGPRPRESKPMLVARTVGAVAGIGLLSFGGGGAEPKAGPRTVVCPAELVLYRCRGDKPANGEQIASTGSSDGACPWTERPKKAAVTRSTRTGK